MGNSKPYKRLLYVVAALAVNCVATAQSFVVYNHDGSTDTIAVKNVQKIVFFDNDSTAVVPVDMGLPSGTKWGSCDIGATRPEVAGICYAWGEVIPKDTYSWSNYNMCDGSNTSLNSYCTNSKYGKVDGLKVLEPKHDAATAYLGEGWKMPSWEDYAELFHYCEKEIIRYDDGITVFKFTSITNGAVLYLPLSGYMNGKTRYYSSRSYHWCSGTAKTQDDRDIYADYYAVAFCFDKNNTYIPGTYNLERAFGAPIRAIYVKDKTK